MDFRGGPAIGTTAMPGAVSATTAPPITGPYGTVPPQKSSLGIMLLVGAALVAVCFIGYQMYDSNQQIAARLDADAQAQADARKVEEEAAAKAEAEAKAKAKAQEEAAKVAPAQPMDVTVAILIRAKDSKGNLVNANILASRDESLQGVANAPAGFSVKIGPEPFEVILRADGFEDLRKSVIPDKDREYELLLVRERRKRETSKRTTKKSPKSGADSASSTVDETKDPPLKTKATRRPPRKKKKDAKELDDLIDPFAG